VSALAPPAELVARLHGHGQEHLLRFWPELDDAGRERLLADAEAIDLDLLDRLVAEHVRGDAAPAVDLGDPSPAPVVRPGGDDAGARETGEAMLRAGEVAVVVVAGGQGTRLGFDGPKGTYPIAPVSGATLFQIHAEKVVAVGRRYGVQPPLYVMTSHENHAATEQFFTAHDRFGLEHLRLFVQGRMPAVDRGDGRVLLAARHAVALSPDGHGGTLRALAAPAPNGGRSCLDEMRRRGVRTIFYFQVDNPLVRIGEPEWLGHHRRADADMSLKVVEKREPGEKVGVVVESGGRLHVIEYSDLPRALAERRRPDGRLAFSAGSIALHVFERAFVERLAAAGGSLPFHRALKKVPYVDETGRRVEPAEPNAVKFEMFIFDALPLARRALVVETDRRTEFEPLKNATGGESPATVRARLSELHAGWLRAAGARIGNGDGDGGPPVEISPLFALDADEVRERIPPGLVVEGPLLLR
jgi:UDP-N-acetylglucosamine/UDP-N-acetylgalactosamine diphosphorylase